MDVEQAVKEYLAEYGDTKESDILAYVKRDFEYSESGSKKLIDRMEQQHQIFRVVHVKLHPPAVYLRIKEYEPLEIRKERIRAQAEIEKEQIRQVTDLKAAEYAAYGGR
jgi:hypothetical protein